MKTYSVQFRTKRGGIGVAYIQADSQEAALARAQWTYKEEMSEWTEPTIQVVVDTYMPTKLDNSFRRK